MRKTYSLFYDCYEWESCQPWGSELAGGQGGSWTSLRKGRRRKREYAVWEKSQEPGRKSIGKKIHVLTSWVSELHGILAWVTPRCLLDCWQWLCVCVCVCVLVVALCVSLYVTAGGGSVCECVCVCTRWWWLCVCVSVSVCVWKRERETEQSGGRWGASDFMKSILMTLCNPQHSVITRLLCSSTEKLTKKETLSLQAETWKFMKRTIKDPMTMLTLPFASPGTGDYRQNGQI